MEYLNANSNPTSLTIIISITCFGDLTNMMWFWWTLSTLFFVAVIVKFLTRRRHRLPPGPSGLPFVGNIFQIDSSCPHGTMTKWSEVYGDIFRIKMFGRNTVVLNSFEAIHEALVTKSNDFAGRGPLYRLKVFRNFCDDVAFSTYSPKWAFMKKTTMQCLKMYGNNLENLEEITLDLVSDMLEELRQSSVGGPCNVFPIIHRCTNGIITSILYGHKLDKTRVSQLLETSKEAGQILQATQTSVILDILPWVRFFPNKVYSKLLQARDKTFQWFTTEIEERKRDHAGGEPKCFLDGLFDQQRRCAERDDVHRLSDSDIYGINSNLIFAGTNTTSSSLYSLIAVLVNKPTIQSKMALEVQQKLNGRPPRLADRRNLHYIEAAILEVFRYSSIIPLNVPHFTTVDTCINGYHIPKNTEVLFNLWKLHHNPEYWDEPWEFRPERFLDDDGTVVQPDHINRRRLLSFGAGRRVCVGETLAKNRLFLMVTSLIQHFEFLPAGPDELPQHDPRDFDLAFVIGPKQYIVKMVPRQ